jgi:hypothetical protein
MTVNHHYFEELATLVASGQLTEKELAELCDHSQHCSSCSSRMAEMSRLSIQLFSALAQNQPRIHLPKGMLKRFTERLHGEGVPLSFHASNSDFRVPSLVGAVALVLLLASGSARFGSLMRSATGDMRKAGRTSHSIFLDRAKISEEDLPGNLRVNSARSNGTFARQDVRREGHESLEKVPDTSRPRLSHGNPNIAQRKEFVVPSYTRGSTMPPRSFRVTIELASSIPSFSEKHELPKFDLAQRSISIQDSSTRFLAECEQRTFAPWSAQNDYAVKSPGTKDLRRDVDLNAPSRFVRTDSKDNLPAFVFIR